MLPSKRKKKQPPQSADSILQQLSRVVHNPQRERFELLVAGDLVGVLGYRVENLITEQGRKVPVLTILHTVLYDEYTGHGLAGQLTRGVLHYAKDSGYQVKPVCTFTQHYLQEHPGYASLAVA